jgi:hypothetical protein
MYPVLPWQRAEWMPTHRLQTDPPHLPRHVDALAHLQASPNGKCGEHGFSRRMDRATAVIQLELEMSTAESILTRNDCGGDHSGIGSLLTFYLQRCRIRDPGGDLGSGRPSTSTSFIPKSQVQKFDLTSRSAIAPSSPGHQRTLMCREKHPPFDDQTCLLIPTGHCIPSIFLFVLDVPVFSYVPCGVTVSLLDGRFYFRQLLTSPPLALPRASAIGALAACRLFQVGCG